MSNADKPAYPVNPDEVHSDFHGLTKREHIAAIVLSGVASKNDVPSWYERDHRTTDDKVKAQKALSLTDALLEELQKPKSN